MCLALSPKVKQDDITFIFAKDFGEEKYFTSVAKDDNGEWIITSNAPKSENGLNNKIKNGGVEIYSKQADAQINANAPYDDVANSNTKLDGADSTTTLEKVQDSTPSQAASKKQEWLLTAYKKYDDAPSPAYSHQDRHNINTSSETRIDGDKTNSTTNTLKAQERQHTLQNPNIEYALKEYKDLSKQELEELITKGERGEVLTQDIDGHKFQKQKITYYKDTTRIEGTITNFLDESLGMGGNDFHLGLVEKIHDVIDPKNWERDLRALCDKIFEYQKTHTPKEGNNFAYEIVSKNPEMFKDYLGAYPKEVYKKRDEILAEYEKKLDEWSIKQPINLQTQGEKSIKELRTSLKEALKDVLNKDITNKQTGMVGRISSTGMNKISSTKALNKSLENGFTKEEHYKVGESIEQLFSLASLREKHADYKGRPNIAQVYRFERPLVIDNKEAIAKITMFEKIEGNNRVYSLELESLQSNPLSSNSHKAGLADNAQYDATARTEAPTIAKSDKENSTTNSHNVSKAQAKKQEVLNKIKSKEHKEYLRLQTKLEESKELEAQAFKELEPIKERILAQTKAKEYYAQALEKLDIKAFNYEIQETLKPIFSRIKKARRGQEHYKERLFSYPLKKLQGKSLTFNEKEFPLYENALTLKQSHSIDKNPKLIKERVALRKAIESYLDIKPIKEFGTNYAEFYRDGANAIAKVLREKQGQVAGAFYKEGLGDIDLVWGNENLGLKKIVDKHLSKGDFEAWGEGEQALIKGLSDIIENGKLLTENNVNTIILHKDGNTYRLGIFKGWFDKGENNWIITAYKVEKKSPDSDSLPSNQVAKSDGTNLHSNDLGGRFYHKHD